MPLEFAGEYTVTVNDGKGFNDSFKIKVPFKVTPENKNVLEHDLYDSTKKGTISFAIMGSIDPVELKILAAENDTDAVADETLYGTFTGNVLESADISGEDEYKKFYVRATIGEESHVVGPFTFIAVVDYTVTVKDKAGAPLVATVGVNGYYDDHVDNGAPKTTNDETGEAVFALPAMGTFKFEAEKTGYIENSTSSSKRTVDLVLDKAGNVTVSGKVILRREPPKAISSLDAKSVDARVIMFKGQKHIMGDTDTNGNYTIALPEGADTTGWEIVAAKDGYFSKTPANDLNLTEGSVTGIDFDPYLETLLDIEVEDKSGERIPTGVSQSATEVIVSIKADENSTQKLTDATDIKVYYSKDPDQAPPVEITDKAFNTTTEVVSFTVTKENFVLLIKPGRGTVYVQNQTFRYIDGEADGKQKVVTVAGAKFDNGKPGVEKVMVDVLTNGISNPATLEIRTQPKKAGEYTNGTPAVYVEISAFDNETGMSLDRKYINRIKVAIPFDTAVIEPGDFEAGKAFVYYAETSSLIDDGAVTVVPVANIISLDYINGQVGFFVDHLTVFAVGTTAVSPEEDDYSSSTCFITTVASGSAIAAPLAALIGMVAACGAVILKRRK